MSGSLQPILKERVNRIVEQVYELARKIAFVT